jgi:hypothetical protein
MTLKKDLDAVFSKYIRLRGSCDGFNLCVTCERRFPIKELQCGHYITRGCLALRFHEKNCHPQCDRCNVFLRGNRSSYALYLTRTYGKDILEELESLKHDTTVKYRKSDYIEMIAYYKAKIRN